MNNAFWLNNPSILINKDHFTELWPSTNLSYAAQLNALTRTIIILSLLGYFITKSPKILITSSVTIVIIAKFKLVLTNMIQKDIYSPLYAKYQIRNKTYKVNQKSVPSK